MKPLTGAADSAAAPFTKSSSSTVHAISNVDCFNPVHCQSAEDLARLPLNWLELIRPACAFLLLAGGVMPPELQGSQSGIAGENPTSRPRVDRFLS
jgi:hypothetical protein